MVSDTMRRWNLPNAARLKRAAVRSHRKASLSRAAAVEREITRDRAVPLACAGLLLDRIAPHDPRASPSAPNGHPSRARGVELTRWHEDMSKSLSVLYFASFLKIRSADCARCLHCSTGWLFGVVVGYECARLSATSHRLPSLCCANSDHASNPSHCCACLWPKGSGETFRRQNEAVRARPWW